MFDLFLTEQLVPFTLSVALLFGLLTLELAMALVCGTLFGLGPDADMDFDLDTTDIADFDLGIDTADLADVEFADIHADYNVSEMTATQFGPAAWLGFGKVPVMIWIAAVLMAFGTAGVILQNTAISIVGAPLPAIVAVLPAGLIGLWFARRFGTTLARLLPKTETTSISNRHLGRHTGVITQGVARRSARRCGCADNPCRR